MVEIGDTPSKIWCLCSHVHRQLGSRYLMEDPSVAKAIENNKPKEVSKGINSLIREALGHISDTLVGIYLQSQSMKFLMQDYGNLVAHVTSQSHEQLSVNKKQLELHRKMLIIIQLTIWSCISRLSYSYITRVLHFFMREKIYLGQDELWSWLYCLTTCVSFNTSIVYDKYATNDEKKYPTCQLLLLPMAIQHNSVNFARVGSKPTFFLPVMRTILSPKLLELSFKKDPVKTVAMSFISYIQGKGIGNRPLLISRNDCTLIFFTEMKSSLWVDFCRSKTEEPTYHQMISVDENHPNLNTSNTHLPSALVSSKDRNCDTTLAAAPSLVFTDDTMDTQQAHGDRDTTHASVPSINQVASVLVNLGSHNTELNQSKHEAVASMHTECEAISSVPLIMDEKYKKLLFHLVKMKNQLDTFQIIQHLESPSTTSTKEKSRVYQDKCIDFCKRKFALKDHQKTIDQYLIKMIAYSGLLIHDILRVKHVKNLFDHQNVFAHVLSYCLEGTFDTLGSYKEQNQNVWKNFFFKLLPRSAFSMDQIVCPTRKVGTFFRKCLDSMEIISPNQNQLDYYFQNDYFSIVSKKPPASGKNKTKDGSTAVEAVVPAGGGEVVDQPSKMMSSTRTEGSLGNKKRQLNKTNLLTPPKKKCGSHETTIFRNDIAAKSGNSPIYGISLDQSSEFDTRCYIGNFDALLSRPKTREQKNSSAFSNRKSNHTSPLTGSSSSSKTKACGSPGERKNSSASSNRKSNRTSPRTNFFAPSSY